MSFHEEEVEKILEQDKPVDKPESSEETVIEVSLEKPRDVRQKTLTEKGQEWNFQEAKRHEKAFIKAYDSWKQTARQGRTLLKSLCSHEDLSRIQTEMERNHVMVRQNYDTIKRNHATTPVIANKMDACDTITEEIANLVSKHLEAPIDNYNEEYEKEIVRAALNKKEFGSIFGHTRTETRRTGSVKSTHQSHAVSNGSIKRVEAEVELAAKLAQAKANKYIQAQ